MCTERVPGHAPVQVRLQHRAWAQLFSLHEHQTTLGLKLGRVGIVCDGDQHLIRVVSKDSTESGHRRLPGQATGTVRRHGALLHSAPRGLRKLQDRPLGFGLALCGGEAAAAAGVPRALVAQQYPFAFFGLCLLLKPTKSKKGYPYCKGGLHK